MKSNNKMGQMNNPLRTLITLDQLIIGPPVLSSNKITTPYTIVKNKMVETIELIYKYDEDVFDPSDEAHINLANMITAQVGLNYGLFCKEIVFKGLFHDVDKKMLRDWMENTSREIYVKKILEPNPFLVGEVKNLSRRENWCKAAFSSQVRG